VSASELDGVLADLTARRFECPVPGCMGRALDHGADGAAPEHWLHESAERTIADILVGSFVQIGAGPRRYSLAVDLADYRDYDAPSVRDLIERLERAAIELRAVAADLEAASR
jgi:hypothetical protein